MTVATKVGATTPLPSRRLVPWPLPRPLRPPPRTGERTARPRRHGFRRGAPPPPQPPPSQPPPMPLPPPRTPPPPRPPHPGLCRHERGRGARRNGCRPSPRCHSAAPPPPPERACGCSRDGRAAAARRRSRPRRRRDEGEGRGPSRRRRRHEDGVAPPKRRPRLASAEQGPSGGTGRAAPARLTCSRWLLPKKLARPGWTCSAREEGVSKKIPSAVSCDGDR